MKQTYAHLKTKLYIIRGKVAHTTMQKYYWRKSKSESSFVTKNTDNF